MKCGSEQTLTIDAPFADAQQRADRTRFEIDLDVRRRIVAFDGCPPEREPAGRFDVLDHAAPIAFGPSLLLSGLVPEPASASADLVLPDAAGAPSYPMELQPDRCHHDGVLSLAASGEPGAEVDLPDLGEPPYRTEVHLTMDGASYVGAGSWPDDLQPRSSNQLVLEWTPPLPEPVG